MGAHPLSKHASPRGPRPGSRGSRELLRWHYLSNATRLMRPRLFYACFVVSRITTICYSIRRLRKTFVRQVALEKWFPLSRGWISLVHRIISWCTLS